jgi:hypothetical protein
MGGFEMTREEHLLKIAEEECSEIAQRISKAMRFGVREVQPGQHADNNDRIYKEYADLEAMFEIMEDEGILDKIRALPMYETWKKQKKEKVEQFLKYSEKCNTLSI